MAALISDWTIFYCLFYMIQVYDDEIKVIQLSKFKQWKKYCQVSRFEISKGNHAFQKISFENQSLIVFLK